MTGDGDGQLAFDVGVAPASAADAATGAPTGDADHDDARADAGPRRPRLGGRRRAEPRPGSLPPLPRVPRVGGPTPPAQLRPDPANAPGPIARTAGTATGAVAGSAADAPDEPGRDDRADAGIGDRPGDRPAHPRVELGVRIKRSTKRRKSVSARMVDGVLEVTVPGWMSRAEQERWADEMRRRHLRRSTATGIDLADRAATLARRYDLPRPRSVRWGEMTTQWGSCTPTNGTIRMSTRLAAYPPWVLDYVLVHELAHLEQADHSPAFWKLVHRYPKAERAIGYLIARSDDGDDDLDGAPTD